MAADNDILRELGEQAPELARLLGNTKKVAPYKVPEGYFETLKMPDLNNQTKEAPVMNIPFGARVIKYAVAAAIISVIALTVWYTIQPDPVKNNVMIVRNDSSSLNNIDNISDEEIEKYIERDISILSYDPGNSVTDIKEEDLSLILSEIPDNELESFLN
jgi:hypothetical protein